MISAFNLKMRQRQVDLCKVKVSRAYTVRTYLKKKKERKKEEVKYNRKPDKFFAIFSE